MIVNGLEAHIFEYTYSLGVFPLRVMQMLVVYEDRVYAITTGSLEAAWDKYEGVFEASLGSFPDFGRGRLLGFMSRPAGVAQGGGTVYGRQVHCISTPREVP